MAESVNQEISDRLVEQQLKAARVEAQQRREVWAILALLQADLVSAIAENDPTQFILLARRRREVEALVAEELDPLITSRYEQIAKMIDDAMVRLAKHESQAVEAIVNSTTQQEMIEAQPSERALRVSVTQSLFPSAATPTDLATVGADWWARQGASLSQRLHDSLLVGVSLEENLLALLRRVRGSSAQAFADGIVAKAKTDASRLLATQLTNTVGEARAAVAAANPIGLIVIHQSVLDSRTSSICLSRHGLKYTADTHDSIGHSIPYLSGVPYHPGCRSSIVPAVDDGGPIRQENVSQWLSRRDTAFQDEVLGPTRAALWRAGRLSIKNLIDAVSGKPLTLEEIGA